jgi:hypothetical protein
VKRPTQKVQNIAQQTLKAQGLAVAVAVASVNGRHRKAEIGCARLGGK